jgi:protein SCO1
MTRSTNRRLWNLAADVEARPTSAAIAQHTELTEREEFMTSRYAILLGCLCTGAFCLNDAWRADVSLSRELACCCSKDTTERTGAAGCCSRPVETPSANVSGGGPYAALNESRLRDLSDVPDPAPPGPRVSDKLPNVELINQNGENLRFLDDLVRKHPVCVVFFYTRCTGSCPGTIAKLRQLRTRFARELPDIRLVSITLEPDDDSPKELREYMERSGIADDPSLPAWHFCTGQADEIDELRRAMGLYDRDPVLDADKTQHAAVMVFGNDRTNRWAALASGSTLDDLTHTIVRIAGNSPRQRYAAAIRLGGTAHGHLNLAGP